MDDFVGQEKLLGKGALLRSLIDKDKVGSLILWGPPGVGKTTIARVIAKTTSSAFKEVCIFICPIDTHDPDADAGRSTSAERDEYKYRRPSQHLRGGREYAKVDWT